MKELQDYSGSFDPNLKLEDFSKDAVIRLCVANSKCFIAMARLWYDLVKERLGEEIAREMDLEIWGNRALPMEASSVCEALNIHGDDVATLFKLFQTQPGFGSGSSELFKIEYELKNPKHGICIVNYCFGVEQSEKYGMMDTLRLVCEEIDQVGFESAAHFFNPKMTVTALKLPHRKNQDYEVPHCVWEYKIP